MKRNAVYLFVGLLVGAGLTVGFFTLQSALQWNDFIEMKLGNKTKREISSIRIRSEGTDLTTIPLHPEEQTTIVFTDRGTSTDFQITVNFADENSVSSSSGTHNGEVWDIRIYDHADGPYVGLNKIRTTP